MPDLNKPARSRFAWLHPIAYLGIHGTVGLAIAAACTWAFFAMADEVPEKGAMVRVDLAVTNWLQAHGTETGETIFWTLSWLGAQVLIALLVVVAIVLVVRRDWRHLGVLAVTCGGGALLNGVLKLVFHRARPSFATTCASCSARSRCATSIPIRSSRSVPPSRPMSSPADSRT